MQLQGYTTAWYSPRVGERLGSFFVASAATPPCEKWAEPGRLYIGVLYLDIYCRRLSGGTIMSKRKAPQGDNPNKDICDMLMGKSFVRSTSNYVCIYIFNAFLLELATYERNVGRNIHKSNAYK